MQLGAQVLATEPRLLPGNPLLQTPWLAGWLAGRLASYAEHTPQNKSQELAQSYHTEYIDTTRQSPNIITNPSTPYLIKNNSFHSLSLPSTYHSPISITFPIYIGLFELWRVYSVRLGEDSGRAIAANTTTTTTTRPNG